MPTHASTPSQRDRRQARKHLDRALGFQRSGDIPRAVEHLGLALMRDPTLEDDPFVHNFTELLLGRDLADALPMLANRDRRSAHIEQLGGKARLRVRQESPDADRATTRAVLVLLGGYGLLVALLAAVIAWLALPDVIAEFRAELTAEDVELDGILTPAQASDLIDPALALVAAITAAASLGSAAGLLTFAAGVHFAALRLLAGTGTRVYLLWRLLRLALVFTLVAAGAALVMLLVIPYEPMVIMMLVAWIVSSVVVGVYMLSALVKDVYTFHGENGCSAVAIGGVITAALGIGLWVLLRIAL